MDDFSKYSCSNQDELDEARGHSNFLGDEERTASEYLKPFDLDDELEESEYENPEEMVEMDKLYPFLASYSDKESREFALHKLIIGDHDGRQRVNNTAEFPWRAICSISITSKSGRKYVGTGWLVGPGTLITAGHNVFLRNDGGWAQSIEIFPGRNGKQVPYGSTTSVVFHAGTRWIESGDTNFDVGAIILPEKIGNKVGYFGFANKPDSQLKNAHLNLSGYPLSLGRGTVQYFHREKVVGITKSKVTYNIDTSPGQSGAPIWLKSGGDRQVVGIHTDGYKTGNTATRINEIIFNLIKRWKHLGN